MTGLGAHGLWPGIAVPFLIESGADGSDVAAGSKKLQRLRWLFLVVQFGGISTHRYCTKLANNLLMIEDLYSESDTDDSEVSDEAMFIRTGNDNDEPMPEQQYWEVQHPTGIYNFPVFNPYVCSECGLIAATPLGSQSSQ